MVTEKRDWQKINPENIQLTEDLQIKWKMVFCVFCRMLQQRGEGINDIGEIEFWLSPDHELEIQVQYRTLEQKMLVPNNKWSWTSNE